MSDETKTDAPDPNAGSTAGESGAGDEQKAPETTTDEKKPE